VRPGEEFSLRLTVELRETPPPAAQAPGARAAPPAQPVRPTTLPDRYFTSRELDVPAVAREKAPLVYPEDPFMWKLSGKVRLRVFINEQGTVDRAVVVHAEPAGDFEEAALAAVRRLVYEPAIKGGRAVKSQKLIEVTFDPKEEAPR
jgi:TonB family protein